MAFNTSVIAGVPVYGSWLDILSLSADDGDTVVLNMPTGQPALRIYDSGMGTWVPPEVYGRFTDWSLTAEVEGSEADAAALLAKGTNVNLYAGSSTLTYNDSGKLRILNSGATDGCAIECNTGPSNGYSVFMHGLARVVQCSTYNDIYFVANDSSHMVPALSWCDQTGNDYPRPMLTSPAVRGTQTLVNSSVATLLASEGFLEVFVIGNNDDRSLPDAAMLFWLNGVLAGFLDKTDMNSGGGSNYCNLVQVNSNTNEITMRKFETWVRA